jgi:probable HAF family extracellular repeat protein
MVSLGGLNSSAQGISADGAVVVGFNNSAAGREAFRWTQAGGMVGLGDLPGGGFASLARAASADGAVIVGEGTSAAGREAFRWTQAGGIVGLGDLPGGSFSSVATAVSANGAVVIGYSNSVNGPEPFRWTQAGGMVGLGDFPGGIFQSYGNAVSADGSVVVGTGWPAGTDYGRAFRWTQATGMVELGTLPNLIESGAHGVSADGSVIVGYYVRPTHAAFIWTRDGGMRDLQDMLVNDYRYDLTGWTLNYAWDVSADGQWVIGSGRSPNGTLEAWVANIAPIPEPSSMALAGLGLAALAGYGWRRRRQQVAGNRQQEASCQSCIPGNDRLPRPCRPFALGAVTGDLGAESPGRPRAGGRQLARPSAAIATAATARRADAAFGSAPLALPDPQSC